MAPFGPSYAIQDEPTAFSIFDHPAVIAAGPEDFDTEWLSLVLGLKVVPDLESAMEHIGRHSTGHSDGILTEDHVNAARFLDQIDSAADIIIETVSRMRSINSSADRQPLGGARS